MAGFALVAIDFAQTKHGAYAFGITSESFAKVGLSFFVFVLFAEFFALAQCLRGILCCGLWESALLGLRLGPGRAKQHIAACRLGQ